MSYKYRKSLVSFSRTLAIREAVDNGATSISAVMRATGLPRSDIRLVLHAFSLEERAKRDNNPKARYKTQERFPTRVSPDQLDMAVEIVLSNSKRMPGPPHFAEVRRTLEHVLDVTLLDSYIKALMTRRENNQLRPKGRAGRRKIIDGENFEALYRMSVEELATNRLTASDVRKKAHYILRERGAARQYISLQAAYPYLRRLQERYRAENPPCPTPSTTSPA